ncbi:MAG: hypothetical protein KIH67_001730 [Candidatus Moranbacteria bacterium]|nr:hypothetical protein [Candidatus Moranbacteria bacterium]
MASVVLSAGLSTGVLAKPVAVPQTSAPREYVNPYQPALECLASQLTPQQKATTIGVAYFAERTGKEAYAPEGASGKFLSQGSEDMLIGDLATTGMTAVEVGPVYRQLTDWVMPRLPRNDANGRPIQYNAALPDIIIEGSFSTLDFGNSDVKELYIFGIGGGARSYSIRYTLDARATSMVGGSLPGGVVLTHLALVKDVVGREKKAGVASFFGAPSSSTYVELNINTQKRELLQYSQRYMVSRAAYGIVAGLWKINTCQAQLDWGDSVISGVPVTALSQADSRPAGQ